MLILEELWERTPALRGVPIYQASGQAKRALSIFQTYIEMMNEDIRRAFKVPPHVPRALRRDSLRSRRLPMAAPVAVTKEATGSMQPAALSVHRHARPVLPL